VEFTEKEIQFLIGRHKVETADKGRQRALGAPMSDLREIGCPDKIFNRMLEDRAWKLGPLWFEFRNRQRALQAAAPADDLASRVEASKLF
jgi:hypothetical protein